MKNLKPNKKILSDEKYALEQNDRLKTKKLINVRIIPLNEQNIIDPNS